MSSLQIRVLVLLGCVALCAACGRHAPADKAQAPAAKQNKAGASIKPPDENTLEDAEKKTADMVHGVSPGKATAPVDLKFSLTAKPELGAPLAIDIALLATGVSDSMALSVQASDGLDVDPTTSVSTFPKSQVGSLYRHQIKVTPRADGVYYVNVLVTTAVTGGPQTRSFSIPLLVGGVAALDKQATAPDAAGSGG
jgi:hypothetical protein